MVRVRVMFVTPSRTLNYADFRKAEIKDGTICLAVASGDGSDRPIRNPKLVITGTFRYSAAKKGGQLGGVAGGFSGYK